MFVGYSSIMDTYIWVYWFLADWKNNGVSIPAETRGDSCRPSSWFRKLPSIIMFHRNSTIFGCFCIKIGWRDLTTEFRAQLVHPYPQQIPPWILDPNTALKSVFEIWYCCFDFDVRGICCCSRSCEEEAWNASFWCPGLSSSNCLLVVKRWYSVWINANLKDR